MSEPMPRRGAMSGQNIIGEVTESIHKFLIDNYDLTERVPRFEEDLSFVPKDREEVIYIYMYRAAQNPNLRNAKRYRQAPVFVKGKGENPDEVYYHRPPLMMDLFYLIGVHSKFRSDAERLLGWVMLVLNEATHLVYRPRKFHLPDGRLVDSIGRAYSAEADPSDDDLYMEKVSLALCDDLTVGDAINFFSIQEAPYRPFLTYRARVAMDGPLVSGDGGTTIRMPRLGRRDAVDESASTSSPSGRMIAGKTESPERMAPGPEPKNLRKISEEEPEQSTENED
ncbi:MAG: Pvc16 family protein [Myxococcota bacterium]|nr:Pvc16 family protein [Myxococcota bacterium]MEC9390968.1 Pvc16 family protein [Myxococcota bacterium]